MLKTQGTVIAYQNGIATVQCQTQTACGSCLAQSQCGTSALSELSQNSTYQFEVESLMPLQIGQQVELGLRENKLFFAATLLYIIPLLTLLISTLISHWIFHTELVSAIFILFCTALSLFIIRHTTRRFYGAKQYQPCLLRTL